MSRRKTIGENPLDALASDPSDRCPSPSVSVQPAGNQSLGQADLLSRIQEMEKQAVVMKWLVYGAIGLALVL